MSVVARSQPKVLAQKCSHNARDLTIENYPLEIISPTSPMAAAVPQEGMYHHFLLYYLTHRNRCRTTYPRSCHQVSD